MSRANMLVIGVILLLLLALPMVLSPFMTQISITTITYSMLGLAFAFSMRVGLPRMDIGAWWGVGAYTTALLMKAGISFWLTALIGGMISVVMGGLLFSLALPRGMIAFFVFCMVLSMAIYQLFGSVPVFGGWGGTTDVPLPTIGSYVIVSQPSVYYLGLFFLILTIVVYYLFYHSKIGRAWDSINSSPKLASSVGVDVVKYRMANVLIGNFFLALAGSYFVSYYRAAIPSLFSFNAGVYVMIYLIIGGFGHSLIGPILGAVIATFIPEYLRFAQQFQIIISSAIVVIILMFLPMGVIGWLDVRIKPWLMKKKWYARFSNWGVQEMDKPLVIARK